MGSSTPRARSAALAVAEAPAAYLVDLPMPEEITERWLEVRDEVTGDAITTYLLTMARHQFPHLKAKMPSGYLRWRASQ